MFERKELQNLGEYFLDLDQRNGKGIFFYRINGYSQEIKAFIQQYYEAARRTGVVIEGRIPNPTKENLSYYEEIMGMDFIFSMGFITSSLKKWLPRMEGGQRELVAGEIYDTLEAMGKAGKTENMLKNTYIKFMCWLYYKFERIVNRPVGSQVPKILYEGDINGYELKLLGILAATGCDVVLLQYHGDQGYLSLDAGFRYSFPYPDEGLSPFPDSFSLKALRSSIEEELKLQRLYGALPELSVCTNTWMRGNALGDILKEPSQRGPETHCFYNACCQIKGVENKLTYLNDLYQFYLQLRNNKRMVTVVDREIKRPSMEEINGIKRGNYTAFDQLAGDLSRNIQYTASTELQGLMKKAFVDALSEEKNRTQGNLNRLMNKGIYLLCWLRRYQTHLFSNWKAPELGCFIYMGGCKDENEALFLKMLSRLPVDVLALIPEGNVRFTPEDPFLREINYEETLKTEAFPSRQSELQMGTVAYHAEQELDQMLYQDSGIFRNQQCTRASTIVLRTMYEEIEILWDQELKYRPNFSVVDSGVNIPVLFAKISGVKDGDVHKYWADIKKLVTDMTCVVKQVPYCDSQTPNPVKPCAAEFLKNGKLQRDKIKNHKAYRYGILRDEIQEHILDKLQLLLDMKSIRGTYENGTEYTIVATALNLTKELLRLIQRFDFTKKNPKLVYINTTEKMISLEDGIITAFLNLIGFDVVFWVPTGYETVERHFGRQLMEEHQIGEYEYDLHPPDFERISPGAIWSWKDKLFKRGS